MSLASHPTLPRTAANDSGRCRPADPAPRPPVSPDARTLSVIQSRPVELDGHLVGIAVNASIDWHFVAIDPVMEELDGAHFPTAAELTRVAAQVLRRSRGPAAQYRPERAA